MQKSATATAPAPRRKAKVNRAASIFDKICREADSLAADESKGDLPVSHNPEAVAQGWQKLALQARAELSAAQVTPAEKPKVAALALMLTEIGRAETAELARERFHARREEIELGLQELG